MARTPEATDFLYPFIERDERDPAPLMGDLARSAQAKWAQSTALRAGTLAESDTQLHTVAAAMAERFTAGGQAFTFGNGGSATDADAFAQLCTRPPWGDQLPARSLAFDQAVLTALSNDIGFDVVFSRQIEAYGRRGDIAIGFSTSGNSDNLLAGFAEASKRGLLTVGLAGYDGGRMGASKDVEHCLVVRSDSVHRVQESQAAVAHVLWAFVQSALGQSPAEQLTDPDQKVAS
ncbi:MAG TPA: SIS domain-containing protein [Acidimicrobiales bacterium]|nr:SIS domain-containing protein [Acidimicrobiales bacterium]